MFVFENLIRNDYFPSELPPCFTTEQFGDKFQEVQNIIKRINYTTTSVPVSFNGYKNENARRRFAIPNPYHYCKAADAIVENSKEIFKVFNISKASLTKPLETKPTHNKSYLKPSNSISESQVIVEQLYLDNLYELRLDIASFFDSIYTHSIPWAIHSKKVAKQDKSDQLVGNILDHCMQSMNYGQTNGILVGNAISRIISEIILCTIDGEIQKAFPNLKYKRYVDDYYIYIKKQVDINEVVSVIRQTLSNYELALNENKIQIYQSPFTYGKPWVEQMKSFLYLEPDLFLRKTIMEYNLYKDIQIIKYGLKVIQNHRFSKVKWQQIESILINLWVKFPSLSNILVTIFKMNEEHLRTRLLKRAIYSIIDNNLPYRNDQEVIWAIWTIRTFNIEVSQDYITLIIHSENWLAIIIMLDIIKTKQMKKTPYILKLLDELYDEIYNEYLKGDSNNTEFMWTDLWLLAYEADKNKWLNIKQDKTFLFARKNEFFKSLRDLDIDFYKGNQQFDTHATSLNKNPYVTRLEFTNLLAALQKSLNSKTDGEKNINIIELSQENKDLVNKLHEAVNDMDY